MRTITKNKSTSFEEKQNTQQNALKVCNKKRLTVMGVEFVYIYLLGIATAFLGWTVENTAKLIGQGMFDCRFHMLPFISPYALIPFAFQIVLGDPDCIAPFGHKIFKQDTLKNKIWSNLLCFLFICVTVFLGEFVVGTLWEVLFGARLWDYSQFPLQVNRYAGLFPSLAYGGGAYLLFKFAFKPALSFIRKKVDFKVAKIICCTLGVLIVLDTCFMSLHIILFNQPPMYWSIHLR